MIIYSCSFNYIPIYPWGTETYNYGTDGRLQLTEL